MLVRNPQAPTGLFNGIAFDGSMAGEYRGSTYFHDASGRGRNGALTGYADPAAALVWSELLGRWLVDFDGSNDYVDVDTADFNDVDFTALSMGGWFAIRADASPYMMAFGNTSSLGASWFYRYVPDQWCWRIAGTEKRTTTTFPADGALHHIFGVFVAGSIKIYVDGVLDTDDAGPASTGTSIYDLKLGASGIGSANINGQLADPLVYSRALDPAEIEWIAQVQHKLWVPWRRTVWPVGVSADPLTLTGAAVDLESPFNVDDDVDTALATGGTGPYSYQIISQTQVA